MAITGPSASAAAAATAASANEQIADAETVEFDHRLARSRLFTAVAWI